MHSDVETADSDENLQRSTPPDRCSVCDTDWSFGGWTWLFGRAICRHCGAPWQILPKRSGLDDRTVPYCPLTTPATELVRAYHNTTGRQACVGSKGDFQRGEPLHTNAEKQAFHEFQEQFTAIWNDLADDSERERER